MATWSERQKQRGNKLSLSWWSARECWRKTINGKDRYFKRPNSAEGYQAALLDVATLMRPPKTEHEIAWELMPASFRTTHEGTTLESLDALATKDPSFYDRALVVLTGNPAKPQSHTVATQIDRFLSWKATQAELDTRAVGTYGGLTSKLRIIENAIGPAVAMKAINGETTKRVYAALLKRDCGAMRKENIMGTFRQWLKWYLFQDDCELTTLPKNLRSGEFSFETGDSRPDASKLFTKAEIATLVTKLPARWRAIILLCLNCGMTQADFSILRRSHVDLDKGRLTHRRKKTKRQKYVPTVNYKLWPVTVDALRQIGIEAKGSGDLIFISRNGLPLVVDRLIEKDGIKKQSKWDTVSRQWGKWQKEGTVPLKPFKFLRKLGATTLYRHPLYNGMKDLYLGHSAKTMAERHYALQDGCPFKPLDKATRYLGIKLGLVEKPQKSQ